MDREPSRPKSGISRRQFLKSFGTIVGMALLPNVPNIPQREPHKEPQKEKEWKLEEILVNPEPFLNHIVDSLKKLPTDKQTEDDKLFLKYFDQNPKNPDENSRDNLIQGFQKYGPTILEYRKTMKDIDLFPGRDIDTETDSFFSNFLRPWANLIEEFSKKQDQVKHIKGPNAVDLRELSLWFQKGLSKDTYEEQKTALVESSKSTVNIKEIEDNIDNSWNEAVQNHYWHNIPEWLKLTDDIKDKFLATIKAINKSLPLAFAFVEKEIITDFSVRDYYEEQVIHQKHLYINLSNLFLGYAKEATDKGKLKSIPYMFAGATSQFFLNRFLITQIHELGHGVDPLFNDNSDTFSIHHPDDYFSYLGEYLTMLKDWTDSFKFMKSKEIDGFLIDPMSVRDGFGIDELQTDEDQSQFRAEISMLTTVCAYIEHPVYGPKYQEILKEIGLDKLFIGKGNEAFASWTHLLDDKTSPTSKEFADNISSFNQISRKHLSEFLDLAEKHFKKNKGNKFASSSADWDKIAISMKSMYILASYKLLSELVKRGEIKNDGKTSLYPIYQTFSNMINWQLCHAATGPLGEYLNVDSREPDLRIEPEKQLRSLSDSASYFRQIQGISNTPLTIETLQLLYEHIAEIQKRRTILWGAKDNSVYPQIAKDVIEGIFGLDSIFSGKG